MSSFVRLYSETPGEILKFINSFYNTDIKRLPNDLLWEKEYKNPVELADIIGTFNENCNNYNINMWISIDKDVFINVTSNNTDELIRYIFERFPY